MTDGSSPLARGLPHRRLRPAARTGIIPARAGFTSRAYWASRLRADHPRSRGVYPSEITRRGTSSGSSPLARGLPGDHITGWCEAGIIPARAGFTRVVISVPFGIGDHPRSRGVY